MFGIAGMVAPDVPAADAVLVLVGTITLPVLVPAEAPGAAVPGVTVGAVVVVIAPAPGFAPPRDAVLALLVSLDEQALARTQKTSVVAEKATRSCTDIDGPRIERLCPFLGSIMSSPSRRCRRGRSPQK
jgi:hypothetical protein